MRTRKVALIGCGRNSDTHLRVYAQNPEVDLVAVCDIDQGLAESKAKRFAAKSFYTSYEKILSLDLDLIDIVTPTTTHSHLAVEALERGHNVLVEKPMAISSRECSSMIAAARRSGRALTVMHNKRFYNSVIQTKEMLERENLKTSRMRLAHFFIFGAVGGDWILNEESGGLLWDEMVHQVYLLQYFLGLTDRVYGFAKKIHNSVYDSITILLESESGEGVGEYEWSSKAPLQTFQIFTKEGDRFDGDLDQDFLVRWSGSRPTGTPRYLRRFDRDLSLPLLKWRSRRKLPSNHHVYGHLTPYKGTFATVIGELVSFLKGERDRPPVEPGEGLRAIRVLEAARESIQTGKVEKVVR